MPRVKHCGSLGCHKLVTYPNRYCVNHQSLERDYSIYNKARNRNQVKSEQYNFYRSKRWVDLRQATLDKQHYLCQYCMAIGIVKPAKIVDHTVPVEYSLDDKANPDNLSVICSACHTAKTKWEQSYYGTGVGNVVKKVQPIKDIKTIKQLFTK